MICFPHSKIKCAAKEGKNKRAPWASVTMVLPRIKNNEDSMGRKKLGIEGHAHHSHFTWDERIQMHYYYTGRNGYEKIRSPLLLGRLLGKHEPTIRRELKRGMVVHEWDNPPFERKEYNAEYARPKGRA